MIDSGEQVSRGVRLQPVEEPLFCMGVIDERIIGHKVTLEDGHGVNPNFKPIARPCHYPKPP